MGVCGTVLVAPTPERLVLWIVGIAVALLGPRVISRTVGVSLVISSGIGIAS